MRSTNYTSITTPIKADIYSVIMYPPSSSTAVGTSTVKLRGYNNMGPYNYDSGGYYEPPETSGVWVYARMNYNSYSDFLADLSNTSAAYDKSMLFSGYPSKKTLFGSVTNYFIQQSSTNE